MKGFVPTPEPVVDLMVDKLFSRLPPNHTATVLDPGCGRGAFIDGLVRWCSKHDVPLPRAVGVDSDLRHASLTAQRFAHLDQVEIRHADFLSTTRERFDYVIGNPPYVPITGLSDSEREAYRAAYTTATGRFDLYLLFFEQALSMVKPGGRLVFITPEKFLYVDTARPLRRLLSGFRVEELHFVDEQTFGQLVTYPLITTLVAIPPANATRVLHRDGRVSTAHLDPAGSSWLPAINGMSPQSDGLTLADICTRISCGVATGADKVFVIRDAELDVRLRRFAHPTIAGRQIGRSSQLKTLHSLLLPYTPEGELLPEHRLEELGQYLLDPARHGKLIGRTCVARKPWYAFHETPPLKEVLRPKLLCKDIGATPFFIADRSGRIIPRHSVYYIVPANADDLGGLEEYVNSPQAQEWLRGHCQRAANGFLRLQSHVLKRLPIPEEFGFSPHSTTSRSGGREAQPA